MEGIIWGFSKKSKSEVVFYGVNITPTSGKKAYFFSDTVFSIDHQ